MSSRLGALLLGGTIALALVIASPRRIVGDGCEYLSQALNFAGLHRPSLGRREIPAIQARVAILDASYANWNIESASVAGPDGRRDFPHFWFYALLAAPFLWLTDGVGVSPILAFALLNGLLLGLALWVVLPRLGPIGTGLLFLSPVIWWIDKPHTEVFTVSLLTIAMALMRDRPAWSLVASGVATTQNPPIAVVFVMIGLLETSRRGISVWRDRRWATAAAVGATLVVLAPVYTYARHGTPSLLLASTLRGFPTFAEMTAVVFDLNVGLLFAFPIFPIAVVTAAIVVARRRSASLLTPDIWAPAIVAITFLAAFASTMNVHHGGTPGMSRYALWLLPLAIPLLRRAHEDGSRVWHISGSGLVAASAIVSIATFYPGRPQNSTEPTPLARWIWTQHPSWSNPLAEVFAESVRHVDVTLIPTATGNCEKVVLAGDLRPQSVWPLPCYPAPLPEFCTLPAVLCYANRSQTAYSFTRAPGRPGPVTPEPNTWPRSAEEHVRTWYAERGWWQLAQPPHGLEFLRASFDVNVFPMGSSTRFVLVLAHPGPAATLAFRLPAAMTGVFLDPIAGTTIGALRFDGPANDLWSVTPPPGHDILVLDMSGASSQ